MHAQLSCVQCHTTITGYPHPPLLAVDRRDFSLRYYPSCRPCHEDQYKETLDSIHLRVLAGGHREAPVCTDCHGAHTVSPPDQPRFKVDVTCSRCHQEIFAVYAQSVHGADLVREEDNPDVPTCTDCHGIHDIKKTDDPESRVVKENLLRTCQQCHPTATANFPTAWVKHYIPSPTQFRLVYYVELFYKIVIPLTIGFFLVFIALDVLRQIVS